MRKRNWEIVREDESKQGEMRETERGWAWMREEDRYTISKGQNERVWDRL